MIITRLIGGMGNQMFQYAAGRALATRLGVPLRVDRRAFDTYQVHAYSLQHFAANIQDAVPDNLPGAGCESRLGRYLRRFAFATKPVRRVVTEKAFTFDHEVLELPDGCYLDGYWQSEKYFEDAAEVVRRDFVIKTPPDAVNSGWLEQIRAVQAVSIHVRRGDYVNNPAANAVHGVCDLDYYYRAVEYLSGRLGQGLEYFVFSDDPEWVRANFRITCPVHYVAHNDGQKNYEDLRLMSACRHHVIANSTFSWWGAWLNANRDSITIAPEKWFKTASPDSRDLLPARWVRL